MHNVQFEITKPTDEAAFEDMCTRIYGTVYKDPLPQTNGRRGQAQGGIDVFIDGPDGRIGIQCKRYADGALKFKHIEHEASEADRANSPVVLLIIATTATSDVGLLSQVQGLSDQRLGEGKYPVKIEFWQDICRHIRGSSKLQNDYAPNAPGAFFHRSEEHHAETRTSLLSIEAKLEVLTGLPIGRSDSVNKFITSQLDAVNEVLLAARFKDAQEDLLRIGSNMSLFDAHQQARWYVQRGVCTWHLENGALAAPDFLHAAELFPDDEKITAAKVRGLLFLDRFDEALQVGQEALERFPASEHVWIAYANARMFKELPVLLTDAPAVMRENADVLQLLAWVRKKAGDLAGAVELSAKALSKAGSAFFVRNTALAFALEAATSDVVRFSNGLVSEAAIATLNSAVDAFSPRNERVWSVQSPESVQDALTHLGFSYLVLGKPEEALVLIEEARHRGALSPRLKRVLLETYCRQDRLGELVQCGREWLDELEEEALILVAETASNAGEASLVDAVLARVEKNGAKKESALPLLQALRWVALWNSGVGRKQALEDIRAADVVSSNFLGLLCGAARVLHAAEDEEAAEAVITKACSLASDKTASSERLLLADLLFATDRFELAARQYEMLAPNGKHSELHNRLLRCYVRTGALRKAKQLVLSFPDSWTSDERALSLAIELGQQASDWSFLHPLAALHCEQRPLEAGAWLLRLVLDLKMRMMARFHHVLESIPEQLSGPPRLLAQVASLELRFGRQESGMRRLYGMFRRNLDDATVASSYFITMVAAPADLPFMEDSLESVRAGAAVILKDDFGERMTLVLDPDGFESLPPRDGFFVPTSETACHLVGAVVGQSIKLPGAFGTERHFVVDGVTTAFRHLIRIAQDRVKSPAVSNLPVMSVPIPTTEEGADFSHMHAMLKRQSEHSKRALQAYGESPITVGMLARLLGRNVVDMITGWSFDAPPLFVSTGTTEQREAALKLLQRGDAEYVVDAATITELAVLERLDVLEALPCVYISTKSVETLEARLEEAKLFRSEGQMFDDNGVMRLVEYTDRDRELHAKFIQGMVDAARQRCTVLPAYGPEELPIEFDRETTVLEEEELATLLLSAEKNATLFTVDGRLAQFCYLVLGRMSVSPQEVLRHAVVIGKLKPQHYSFVVARMFLRNRSFVSLGANDFLSMLRQGGATFKDGFRRFKEYLSSSAIDFNSALDVAFESLELQARHPTQFRAFFELFGHLMEALLRHPHCERIRVLNHANDFVCAFAQSNSGESVLYAPAERQRQSREKYLVQLFADEFKSAEEFSRSLGQRAIKLGVLMCAQPPCLVFDGGGLEPDNLSSAHVEPVRIDDEAPNATGTTSSESSPVYFVATEQEFVGTAEMLSERHWGARMERVAPQSKAE